MRGPSRARDTKTCLESAEGPREPGYPSTEGRTPGRMSEGKQDTERGDTRGAPKRYSRGWEPTDGKERGGSATSQSRKRRLRPDLEKIPEGSRRREGRDQESSTGLSAARGRRSPSAQHESQSDHRRKLTPPRREGTPRKLPGGNGGRPPAKARRSGGRRTSRSQIWPWTRSSKVGRRITSNLKFYTQ